MLHVQLFEGFAEHSNQYQPANGGSDEQTVGGPYRLAHLECGGDQRHLPLVVRTQDQVRKKRAHVDYWRGALRSPQDA